MILVLLLILIAFLYIYFPSSLKPQDFQQKNQELSTLIKNYAFVPKTFKQKIHIIIPLKSNVDNIINNILKQTEKVDIMTIIVPQEYENELKNGNNSLCKLLRDTCIIQISGGYGMLSKEREKGTILVYVNNLFSDPNTLKNMLNRISTLGENSKKIFYFSDATIVDNSIPIGIDDAYKL